MKEFIAFHQSFLKKIFQFSLKTIFLIPTFWLIIFFLIPLTFVWIYSFSEVQDIISFKLTWTLKNYREAFEPVYLSIIFKSIWMAGLTTLICLVLGLIVSIFIAFNPSKVLKNFFLLLIILPFWTNMLIRTYALIAVLRTTGYINKSYNYLWDFLNSISNFLGLDSQALLGDFTPLNLLYNNGAVILGLVYIHLPFMILPLFGVLEKLEKSYIEASFDLGAGKITTLFKVILPKISEGIYAGLLITFIPALGSFLTPDLLGGNDSQMIANVIERQFKGANDWPFGSSLSFLLMYLLFFIVAMKSLMKNK